MFAKPTAVRIRAAAASTLCSGALLEGPPVGDWSGGSGLGLRDHPALHARTHVAPQPLPAACHLSASPPSAHRRAEPACRRASATFLS
eukprot:366106-Chlamydomonas_euryale.AAC.10